MAGSGFLFVLAQDLADPVRRALLGEFLARSWNFLVFGRFEPLRSDRGWLNRRGDMDDPDLDDLDPDELLGDLDDLDAGLFGKKVPKASPGKTKALVAAAKDEAAHERSAAAVSNLEDAVLDETSRPAASRPTSSDRKSRLMSDLFDRSPPGSPIKESGARSRPSSGTRPAPAEKSSDSDDILGDLGFGSAGGGKRSDDASRGRKLGGSMFDSLLGPSPAAKEVAKVDQLSTDSPKKSVSFVLDEKYKKKSSPERSAEPSLSGYSLTPSSSDARETRMSRAQRASSTTSFGASSSEEAVGFSFKTPGDGEGPSGGGRRKKSSRQSSPGGPAPDWLGFGDSAANTTERRLPSATGVDPASGGGDLWASLGFKTATVESPKKNTAVETPSQQPIQQSNLVAHQQEVPPASTTVSNESFFSTQTLFTAAAASPSVASFSPGEGPLAAPMNATSSSGSFIDVNSQQMRTQELRWQQMLSEQETAFRQHMQSFKEKQTELQRSNENLERLAKEKLLEQQQTQLLVMQRKQQEEMQRQMTSFMVMMQEMRQQQMMSALEQQELLLTCQANPLAAAAVNPTTLAGLLALQGIVNKNGSTFPASNSSSAADVIAASLAGSKTEYEADNLKGPVKAALDISEEIMKLKGELRRLEIDRDQWKSSYESALAAHKNEITLLTESHDAQRKLLQDSLERANGRHLFEIGALADDHSRQMATVEANNDANVKRYLAMLESKDKEREDALGELEVKHRSVVEALKRSHGEALESMLKTRALEVQANEALASKSSLLEPLVEQLRIQMADLHNLKAKLDHDTSTLDESKALVQQNAELRLQVENETLAKDNKRLVKDLEECYAVLKRKEEELKAMRVDMEEEKWALSRARQKLEKEKLEFVGEKAFWESQKEREINHFKAQKDEFEEFAEKMRADLNKQKNELLMRGESIVAQEAVDAKLRNRANLHYNQEKLQAEAALETLAEEHARLERKRKDVLHQEDLLKKEKKELEEQWLAAKKEKEHLKEIAASMKELKDKLSRERAECLEIKRSGEQALAEARKRGSSYVENEKRLAELLKRLIDKEEELKTEQDRLYVDRQTLTSQKDQVFICQLCSSALVDTRSFTDVLQGTSMDAVDLPYDDGGVRQSSTILFGNSTAPLNHLTARVRQQRQMRALDGALLGMQAGSNNRDSTIRVPKGNKKELSQGVPKISRQLPRGGNSRENSVLQRSRSLSMRRRNDMVEIEDMPVGVAISGRDGAAVLYGSSSNTLIPTEIDDLDTQNPMSANQRLLHSPVVSMANLREWEEQAQRDSDYLRSRSVWLQTIEHQLNSGELFKR